MKKSLALTITSLLLLTACQKQPGEKEPLKLGYIGPLTGNVAAFGNDGLNAVKLAAEEINAAGGLDGRLIQVIGEDGKCTGSEAAAATQKLVHIDKVVAIVGGLCSSETLTGAPIAEAAQVIMLSPGSSSPDITTAGDFIFRNYPNDADKTIAMVRYFLYRGYKKIAILSSQSDFSQAFHDALLKDLSEDMEMVFDEFVDQDTKDFRSLMTRLKDVEFDVFFPNISNDASIAVAMKQFREQGLTQPAVTHDYGDSKVLIEIAPDATEGLHIINVPDSGAGTDLERKLIERFGGIQGGIFFAAHAYDAANLLFQVIAEVGTEGPAIRDGLNNLKAYDGIIGRFHFDKHGDVIGVPFVLKEFKNGEIVTIADLAV